MSNKSDVEIIQRIEGSSNERRDNRGDVNNIPTRAAVFIASEMVLIVRWCMVQKESNPVDLL